MSDALSAATQRIFLRLGAVYKADVFSILRRCLYAVRSFEFALANSALDYTTEYPDDISYSDRFYDVVEHIRLGLELRGDLESELRNLALFDVKSSVANAAGTQQYIISIRQRRRVAFIISVITTDPTFVDLIPNFY